MTATSPAEYNGPQVRYLSQITLGAGVGPQLLATIIEATDANDVQPGLQRIADATYVSAWTVYRWLIGTHDPTRNKRLWTVVERLAESCTLGGDADADDVA